MSSAEFIGKDKKTGRITFRLKGMTPTFVNGLRRLCMDSVPTMAIEEVDFKQNSSALYDEVLAHRLGLLPLVTDLKSYMLPEKCKCDGEGCNRCTLKLTLKAKGPAMVYAKEIKSKDPKVKPAQPDMPIVKLLKGQELEFEATAVLGRGQEHAKWSSCLAYYSYAAKATVNNNHPRLAAFRDKYPPQVLRDGKIDKKLIEEYGFFDACDGVNDEIVKVDYDPKTFLFHLEPWGQLAPKEILNMALTLFDERLEAINKELSSAK